MILICFPNGLCFYLQVIQPLKDYKELCRKGKADLKRTGDAYKKEKSQQAAVQKMGSTGKEHNISQVSKAQSELRQSAAQAAKQTKDLEQGCQSFEERRVADMKQVSSSNHIGLQTMSCFLPHPPPPPSVVYEPVTNDVYQYIARYYIKRAHAHWGA